MKPIVLLLIIVLLANCTSNKIKRYRSDRAKWKGIIYEGIGVDGVILGDKTDIVKSLLGEPEFVWTNKSNKYHFFEKYMYTISENEGIWLFESHHGYLTLYLTDKKKIVALTNPLFDYSYIYYNKGITLFFDEYDKVVEIIVLFETPIHRLEIKGKVTRPISEYKHYTGRLWYGNITATNATLGYLTHQYKEVLPKSKWNLIGMTSVLKDIIYLGKNSPLLNEYAPRFRNIHRHTSINFDCSITNEKSISLKMYSPMLGLWIDSCNPWEGQHVEEALERRKKYIKKYGYKYY